MKGRSILCFFLNQCDFFIELCNLLLNTKYLSVENKSKIDFLKFYEPIHTQFFKFCRAISGNTEDAEDLIQDTILNVLEGLEKIKDFSVFKSYVFSIALQNL